MRASVHIIRSYGPLLKACEIVNLFLRSGSTIDRQSSASQRQTVCSYSNIWLGRVPSWRFYIKE